MQQIDLTTDELEQSGYKLGKRYVWGVPHKNDNSWHDKVYVPASAGVMCDAHKDGYTMYTKPVYEHGEKCGMIIGYGLER